MTEKIKTLSLSKLKIAEAEEGKERRVTFVASSSNEDRDYETLDIGSFRLPKKGGGHITVRDLPTGGADNVVIPFLTNHDLWEVEKTIGSVRRAEFVDGELIFEAGISGREYAQDVFKLIEEGHLDNAFSIQFRDYEYNPDSKLISNGEIIEVSLVTRGSNKEAQVLEVKQVKGQEMDPEDNISGSAAANTNAEPAPKAEKQASTQQTQEEAPAKDASEQTENVNNSEEENKEKTVKTETNHNQLLGNLAKMPSQAATSANVASGKDYLKSKQAENDFAKHIYENYGQKSTLVLKSWGEKLKAKGITGDAILPTRLENIFFKAWDDLTSPLSTFYRIRKLEGSLNAWTTEDGAKRHKKGGKDKVSQDVSNKRRDYKAVMIYKMLEIDLEDLIFDDGGELTLLRNEELTERINGKIVKAAIVGDGLPTTDDDALFDGTRGIWSIKYDLDNSSTAGSYSSLVASTLNEDDNPAANIYEKIILTAGAVKGGEGEKVVFVPEGTIAQLTLMKNENGGYLFQPGTNFDATLRVRIFEADYMTGSGYDVIAYRSGKYGMPLGDMMTRTGFDMHTNKDGMLQERMVAGSLFGSKVAAGYASK